MKCKLSSDPPANKSSNRLTRTSSASRTIKSTTSSSHGNNTFKIKLKHGLSPSRNSSSNIHGCRTQTRSSTSSSAASTSRSSRNHGNGGGTTATATSSSNNNSKESAKEMKKSKDSGNHRCNCICANCGLSIDDSVSMDNHRDVSLIREPINLGTKNVRQILQCVHNGTPEIKDIVLNECNIIYECRMCLNLFRSLANLLSHKRYYCKDHKCESMLLFDDKYLTRLPEEDNIFANFELHGQQQQQIQPTQPSHEISTKSSSNNKTTGEQSTTSIPKVKNRRKQETTFAGPIDPRDEPQPSSSLLSNTGQKINLQQPLPPRDVDDDDDDDDDTRKVQPETVAAKRKHLESCVNKLLYEKSSSPKVDQLTTTIEDEKLKTSFTKQSEEINQPVIDSLNMDDDDNHVQISQDEQKSSTIHEPLPVVSPSPPQEDDDDDPMKETSVQPTTSTNPTSTTTTTATTTISTSPTTNPTTTTATTSTKSIVFNIDENANHPVAGEESESNMQEIVSYPQSITSLVSDDDLSEMFPSEDNSQMDTESIDVDETIITINNNKEASQQSLTSSSSPSSSSPSSSTREHSSSNHRNKPKTFDDDTYETKPSPVSTVPCSMCNSKFSSKKTLNVHIQTIHNIQRLIYPCPFCCLTFKQLFNATRHMIQVHRKGKTQVKFLREAVKRRAYPEVKSDENEDESTKADGNSNDGDEFQDNHDSTTTELPPPLDNLDNENEEEEEEEGVEDENEEEEEEEEDKSNPDNPFNLKAIPVLPIAKVGKSVKRKSCDSFKEEYKSSSSSSSSSSSPTEIKLTINHKQQNNGNETMEIRPKRSLELDKKEMAGGTNSNQEKVRRVNPIIFSCINNCGEYFIKVDSKNQHEKKCSKPDDDGDDDDDDDNLANQEKSNYDLTDSSNSTNHQHHHHHHHHHHRSKDGSGGGLDLTIINESIYKELEKVGNLTTRRCNHCPDLLFKTKSLLIQHLIVHIGYEVLKCKKCAYQTLNRTEMDTHLGSAHGTPEILRGSQIVNLSMPLNNDTNGSVVKKTTRVELKEDSQESTKGNTDETKGSSEKSNSSSIVLHLRPKLSRSRKKKKIYEIVGD